MKVTHTCLTLYEHMNYTVHGVLQARILEWVIIPFSRGSSQSRDQTQAFKEEERERRGGSSHHYPCLTGEETEAETSEVT